ncbi:MAG TPA: DJ-1/PfpI family protein [Dongiaceae bacterium]|nr:DJ-1/PfpI family protein [Dongiaceae bacterium]
MTSKDTSQASRPLRVVILLFPDVEVLDFAGPFEVFSLAAALTEPRQFEVMTVAAAPLLTIGGLRVTPGHSFDTCPQADILLLPGGMGSRRAVKEQRLLDWVAAQAAGAAIAASICTGALLLGRLGMLDGLRVTTHWGALDLLQEMAPAAVVLPNTRFIDNGRIVTSAGISAGIDMSLHLVARLAGETVAENVAREMEYEGVWRRPEVA